jgi:hypothetical protein
MTILEKRSSQMMGPSQRLLANGLLIRMENFSKNSFTLARGIYPQAQVLSAPKQ